VTFTKVLAIYHSWIHTLHRSPVHWTFKEIKSLKWRNLALGFLLVQSLPYFDTLEASMLLLGCTWPQSVKVQLWVWWEPQCPPLGGTKSKIPHFGAPRNNMRKHCTCRAKMATIDVTLPPPWTWATSFSEGLEIPLKGKWSRFPSHLYNYWPGQPLILSFHMLFPRA
jgi:hypothetical protein